MHQCNHYNCDKSAEWVVIRIGGHESAMAALCKEHMHEAVNNGNEAKCYVSELNNILVMETEYDVPMHGNGM